MTAVYIGRGWALSAAHAPVHRFELDGRVYPTLHGSGRQLRNPDGTPSDLLLFRIGGDPGLPALAIAQRAPSAGASVLMIGRGRGRGAAIRDPGAGDPGGLRDERGLRGWAWGSGQEKRWGTNVLNEGTGDARAAGTITRVLVTEFSAERATVHEGQAAPGDSGGAAFVKQDGRWQLAGVLIAITRTQSKAALYGDYTLFGDLSYYRDQIFAVTAMPDTARSRRARLLEGLRGGFRGLLRSLRR